ncbi:hypothetical protein AURDEDRAFT_74247, partial [Auricularia subglabra TFB-10046 SS5]
MIVELKQTSEEETIDGLRHVRLQRGMKGHIIVYPQHPEILASSLPPSIEDTMTNIAVIFVGSTPPSAEWLRTKAKPLTVRADRVRKALVWLKEHNPLYRDITINGSVLSELERNPVLPFDVQHVRSSSASDVLTSRYDAPLDDEAHHGHDPTSQEIDFETVVIADVEGHIPSNDLRRAAFNHIMNGGGYLQLFHDQQPANSFNNPELFPMAYPTLFPYGSGGFECRRKTKLSLKQQVK